MRKKDEEHSKGYKKKLNSRVNRIIGQLNGINKMIEEDIYCDEILNQVASAKSALNGLGMELLKTHLKTCVTTKVKNGDSEVLDELLTTIKKLAK